MAVEWRVEWVDSDDRDGFRPTARVPAPLLSMEVRVRPLLEAAVPSPCAWTVSTGGRECMSVVGRGLNGGGHILGGCFGSFFGQ